jgi:hypothetical protein
LQVFCCFVLNLKAGKNENRKSGTFVDSNEKLPPPPSAAPANAATGEGSTPTLRRQISEKFSRSAIAKAPAAKSEAAARSRANTSNAVPVYHPVEVHAVVVDSSSEPKTLAKPGGDRDALVNTLASCATNLSRLLGSSSSKASRMLGDTGRARASSMNAGQNPGEATAVLEAAVQLGAAVANLTSKLNEAALVREVLAKYKAFDEIVLPLADKMEEWREVKSRKPKEQKKEGNNIVVQK